MALSEYVTGRIIVKLQPKLLSHTPAGDGFMDLTSRVMFSENGNDSTFEFTQSADGNQASAKFSLFTMFPISANHWSTYTGATDDLKVQAAVNDYTYDFEVPARTEVKIYERDESNNDTLIFGGVVTEVARVRTSGMIVTNVTCADYTALLDELVIDRYKVPYLAKDYEIIKGGANTDSSENAQRITKLNDGGSGGTREIYVALRDSHDLSVGQQVVISNTTNYNGTWTVSEIVSLTAYKATQAGSTYNHAAETSGTHVPKTYSFFGTVRASDPYSGNSFAHGITYNGSDVQEGLSDYRFSPVTYLPDTAFPQQLGAKLWIPFGETKTSLNRLKIDPKSGDTNLDQRLARIESIITPRWIVTALSTNASGDLITSHDLTIIGSHYMPTGTIVNVENAKLSVADATAESMRMTNTGSTSVVRIESESQEIGFDPIVATVTALTHDSTADETTYTTSSTLNILDDANNDPGNGFRVGDYVGITGITQSTSGTGTYNVPLTKIVRATANTFTISNKTTKTATSFSGAKAGVTCLVSVGKASMQAEEQKWKILAGARPAESDVEGTAQIWFNEKQGVTSPTGEWFVDNERAFIYGSNGFDKSPLIVGEQADDDGQWNSGNPKYRVAQWKRVKGIVTMKVAVKVNNKWKATSKHPFDVGSVIDVAGIPADGLANGPNGTSLEVTSVTKDGWIRFALSGNRARKKFVVLTQTQRKLTTILVSSSILSQPYLIFSDTRATTANGTFTGQTPERIGNQATLALYQWAWPANGDRAAGTPSATFTTMPYDDPEFIGGRQGVKFVNTSYNRISSTDRAKIYKIRRSGTLVTVLTYAPVTWTEGQMVRVDCSNSAINGTFSVIPLSATVLPSEFSEKKPINGFQYNTATSGTISATTATGYAYQEHDGFWAMGKSFSAILCVRLNSLPSSGQYYTIWHHGSVTTGQRRELLVDSSGQILFGRTNSSTSATGISVVADEEAILYVSLNSSTGALRVRKNDETVYSTTLASNYSGTSDGGSAVGANLTFGHGYSSTAGYNNFLDATVCDFIVFDSVLSTEDEEEMIAWYAHWYTLQGNLSDENSYREIINLRGKVETNRAKEPFNGMTLRQAMDYICTKTGCQYWVDETKTLHYVKRNIKNLVTNPTFEDTFGGSSTANWTVPAGFSIGSRTSGPYGYGYAMVGTGSSAIHALSKKVAVSAGEVLWVSAMMKSDDASKSRLKVRFFDSGGTQVGSDHTIGSGLSTNGNWEKMWGMVAVPDNGSSQASVCFDHNSHSHTYNDYWSDPVMVKISGEFGFADYGRAPGSNYELLFDPQFNDPSTGILPLKTFETPENISSSGSVANRLYIYGLATSIDNTGQVVQDNEIYGQVTRYTFDRVQGVWASHGKLIEASKIDDKIETRADAAIAAETFWSENGQTLESYSFDHPTAASGGRLSVGSVIPYLWTEVGIVQPIVVKSQTTKLIGSQFFYSVELAGEPEFQSNAIILVKKEKITVSLGSGALAMTKPTMIRNLVISAFDQNGKIEADDLRLRLQWDFDQNDPRNKKVSGFEINRRAQKLKRVTKQGSNFKNFSAVGLNDNNDPQCIKLVGVAAGGLTVVRMGFGTPTGLVAGDIIEIANYKNGRIFTSANPSLDGTWAVSEVRENGKIIHFNIRASSNAAIATRGMTKTNLMLLAPKMTVTWRAHQPADAASDWKLVTTVKSLQYDDINSEEQYRYQYRIRAVVDAGDGAKMYGDWVYAPPMSANPVTGSQWVYVNSGILISVDPPLEEDVE